MRLISALLVSFAIVAGCRESATLGTVNGFVHGHVVSGPTTPVFRPDDPSTADRPVVGARILLESLDGRPAETLVSDSEGRFSKSIAAGRYRLVPQPVIRLVGTAAPIEFTLQENGDLDLTLHYDTGIR